MSHTTNVCMRTSAGTLAGRSGSRRVSSYSVLRFWLPVVVFLIAQLHEQIPCLFLEDPLVLLGEVALPVTCHALPEEGGRVLLAPLPALRELLEAGLLDAASHDLLVGTGA